MTRFATSRLFYRSHMLSQKVFDICRQMAGAELLSKSSWLKTKTIPNLTRFFDRGESLVFLFPFLHPDVHVFNLVNPSIWMWKIWVRFPSGKTSMSWLAIFCLFNSSNLIMMSSWWRRRRINSVWIESVVSKRRSPKVHTSNWLPTYCLRTMSDGLMWRICLLILLWHDIARRDAPDVLRNLAMDFSTVELLASPPIPSFAVAIHMDWKHTWSHAFCNVPTCILVMIRHCVCWMHLLLWAFDSSYVFFFSASFFFALIASTWHHLRTFKHALTCLSFWAFPALQQNKYRTKPPGLSISHPCKRKRQQFDYKSFGDMLPEQLSFNWWNFYHKCQVIADVLAVLASAPRSSMPLYTTREWPAVGSFWSSALQVWPRVLCPSRARYVRGKQYDKRQTVKS